MPLTPRQMVQELLHGTRPSRPLFLPVLFSMGAKLENLSLREFLGHATKISNSLRQIHARVRADGVSCYFDPILEAEALGATIEWEGDAPRVAWSHATRDPVSAALKPAEVLVRSGRVPVAIDVIKRLNALVHDGTLLTAGVTGPLTLASKIIQRGHTPAEIPAEVLEYAASLTMAVASAFTEAGANVIFIREELSAPSSLDKGEMAASPVRSGQGCSQEMFENWMSLLSPTFNVVRFYQALPVLQLNKHFLKNTRDLILDQQWECVISTPIDTGDWSELNALGLGLVFRANGELDDQALGAAV